MLTADVWMNIKQSQLSVIGLAGLMPENPTNFFEIHTGFHGTIDGNAGF